ncbi:MAG: AAA family ATPase [Bacteroidaceae bacterium]|nr:AAA family ATPase [Bacteroidaceae bacterium]
MENGYIRIGWHNYGDVEDFNDYDNFSDGGKNVLRAFQSSMQIGDLVVSCYSAKEIDAVGVITGEYEYRADGGHYPRYRTVKWLVKDIRENIIELNKNKPFTLSTIYKANIKAEAVLKIVQKYSANIAEVVRKDIAVFVIDEINRGEISKIFGELFFSIDPGYRGNDGIVKTQYQNMIDEGDAFKDGFYVPENVYIIGTMNDIDRSVESMDFAMRRRFAWEEVTAEESIIMLNGIENEAEIKARMISLNNAIAKIDVLGTQYQIGAAYFKKIADNKENFQELWDYHLKGLLYEYLRGSRDVKSQMDKLEKAYNRVNPDEPVD